jgi:hypothetical protein
MAGAEVVEHVTEDEGELLKWGSGAWSFQRSRYQSSFSIWPVSR